MENCGNRLCHLWSVRGRENFHCYRVHDTKIQLGSEKGTDFVDPNKAGPFFSRANVERIVIDNKGLANIEGCINPIVETEIDQIGDEKIEMGEITDLGFFESLD